MMNVYLEKGNFTESYLYLYSIFTPAILEKNPSWHLLS